MAGDWIKMELCLPDKPEVLAMSALTGMEPDLIVGKCFRVWRWFDQHTEEGNAVGVTLVTLGYAIGNGLSSTAFLDALKAVGWIDETHEGVRLPNFDRHNGETAKKRALTAKRVAKHKSSANAKGNAGGNAKGNAINVTEALPREEKRREEDSVAKATVGEPPKVTDPDEIIFGYGVPLLTNAGTAEKQARSFLGGLRKNHGDAVLIDKLRDCLKAKPLQPLEWLAAAMPPPSAGAGKSGHMPAIENFASKNYGTGGLL